MGHLARTTDLTLSSSQEDVSYTISTRVYCRQTYCRLDNEREGGKSLIKRWNFLNVYQTIPLFIKLKVVITVDGTEPYTFHFNKWLREADVWEISYGKICLKVHVASACRFCIQYCSARAKR